MPSNILVIEDKQADAELIKYYLQEAAFKHNFYHTESLKDGFTILSENEIDIVILDLSIRDSIGFSTLTKYLEEAPNTPVIVMTGMNNAVVGIQSVKAGAQDFLVKGEFDSRSLVRTIRYSLQRFKTQEKLRETATQLSIHKERSKKAHEMAKFANWEMDIVNNAMTWSDEMYRIFGFEPHSFPPSLSDYLNYVHVEDKEKVHIFFENVIKDGAQKNIEHRIIVDGRKLKLIELKAMVNYDEVSNKILLIGSVQDISNRSPSAHQGDEDPKPNSSSQNIRQNILSELSFNIRTPMSSIVNLLYLIENSSKSPQQQELIAGLKASFDDLSIVFNDLLNFSILITDSARIEEEDFNFKEFLSNYQKELEMRAHHAKVTIQLEREQPIPERINSDPQKVMQLINNVLSHAIKYSEEGDTILITVSAKKTSLKENHLHFVVTYRGNKNSKNSLKELTQSINSRTSGITASNANDAKRQMEKVIINKLIRAFNGKFQLLSGDRKEISVQIEIPVKIPTSPAPQLNVEAPSNPLHILLVEDHPINRIATRRLLTIWSDQVTVDEANNGEECLQKIKSKAYNLILMDLNMPKMNGIEATIKIRSQHSTTPVVALTANASKKEEEKCMAVGMNAYMVKPFQPNDLYAQIMKLTNSN